MISWPLYWMYPKNALLFSQDGIVWKDDARLVASHRGRTKGVLGEPSSTLPHALSGLLAVEERTQNELRTRNAERRTENSSRQHGRPMANITFQFIQVKWSMVIGQIGQRFRYNAIMFAMLALICLLCENVDSSNLYLKSWKLHKYFGNCHLPYWEAVIFLGTRKSFLV